jgi:hypothetical protein
MAEFPGSNEVFKALGLAQEKRTLNRIPIGQECTAPGERGQVFTVYYGDSTLLTVRWSTVKTCFRCPRTPKTMHVTFTIPQRGGNNDEVTEFDGLRSAACVRRSADICIGSRGGGSAAHRCE